jgi:nucleotide-binding universal stress UspA family protein
MFKKILVATDGSTMALRGAEVACALAKKVEAEVTLVYVAYVPALYTGDISGNLMESFIEDGKKILHDTEQIFKREGYPATIKLVRDKKPSTAICELAEDFDLLILGARGLHECKFKTIGSTCDSIVHCAPCSVLLVQ